MSTCIKQEAEIKMETQNNNDHEDVTENFIEIEVVENIKDEPLEPQQDEFEANSMKYNIQEKHDSHEFEQKQVEHPIYNNDRNIKIEYEYTTLYEKCYEDKSVADFVEEKHTEESDGLPNAIEVEVKEEKHSSDEETEIYSNDRDIKTDPYEKAVEKAISKFKPIAPKPASFFTLNLPASSTNYTMDTHRTHSPKVLDKTIEIKEEQDTCPSSLYKCDICSWQTSGSLALLGNHYAIEHHSRLPDKILDAMIDKEEETMKKAILKSSIPKLKIAATRYCFVCGTDLVIKNACSFLTHLRKHFISTADSKNFQTWELDMEGTLGIKEDIVELLIYILQSYLYEKDMYCWLCCEIISNIPDLLKHFDQVHHEYSRKSENTIRLPNMKKKKVFNEHHCLCLYCHFVSTEIIELKAHLRYQHAMTHLETMKRALICGIAYTVSGSGTTCDLCKEVVSTQSFLNLRATIVGHMTKHHLENRPLQKNQEENSCRYQNKNQLIKSIPLKRKRTKVVLMCSCCNLNFFDIKYLKSHVKGNKACLAFHIEAILSENDKKNPDKNTSISLLDSDHVDVEELAQNKTEQIVKFLKGLDNVNSKKSNKKLKSKSSVNVENHTVTRETVGTDNNAVNKESVKNDSVTNEGENVDIVTCENEYNHKVKQEKNIEYEEKQTLVSQEEDNMSTDEEENSETPEQEYEYVLY